VQGTKGSLPGGNSHKSVLMPESLLNIPGYLGVVADLYHVPRQLVKAMQSIEVADPKVARRARFAQLRGEKVTLNFKGSTVTGLVRSLREDSTSTPPRWIVTVVGKQAVAA
jgi:hypothetical protein